MRHLRLLAVTLLGLALLASGGCMSRSKKKDYPSTVARFFFETASRDGGVLVALPQSGVAITVEPKAQFTEYDVEKCEVVNNEFGKSLAFRFTQQAGRDLYRATVPAKGRRIVTTINGRPVGARLIEGPLSQGYLVTYVEIPEAELEKVAENVTKTSTDLREELDKKQK